MRKFVKHWLTVLFVLTIGLESLATLAVKTRSVLSSAYSSVKGSINREGVQLSTISHVLKIAENSYTDNLFGQSYWVEVLGFFNKSVNKKIFLDTEDRYTVYKMNNGQETGNYIGYNTTPFAENYIKFAANIQKEGIPLLYVQAPFKINKYDNQLPYGIEDETNPLADNFLNLVSGECDTYDLRELIYEQGLDYSSLFYNTDHHWNAQTGLWASGVITEKLIEAYGLDLDDTYLSKENYIFTVYENYMLGSYGKRAGIYYSGLDDFVLIEPTYETDYYLMIPSLGVIKEGSYSETILFKQHLSNNYYSDDPGRVYTGDNYSLMIINNRLAKNNTRILLIKDSFSKSVIPSFASTCSELHIIDLRTFEGSVLEYALKNNIDVIVVMYNPSVVVNPDFFEFE